MVSLNKKIHQGFPTNPWSMHATITQAAHRGGDVALFCAVMAALWLALTAAAAIPNAALREQMEQSALTYAEADAFPFTASAGTPSATTMPMPSCWALPGTWAST